MFSGGKGQDVFKGLEVPSAAICKQLFLLDSFLNMSTAASAPLMMIATVALFAWAIIETVAAMQQQLIPWQPLFGRSILGSCWEIWCQPEDDAVYGNFVGHPANSRRGHQVGYGRLQGFRNVFFVRIWVKLSETCFGKVSRRLEPYSKGKQAFEVCTVLLLPVSRTPRSTKLVEYSIDI